MGQLSQELVGETRDCGALALISKFFGIVLNVATEGKMGRVRSSGSGAVGSLIYTSQLFYSATHSFDI